MASPTLIAFSEKDTGVNGANVASEATATLTWQTGDVLVAMAVDEGSNNAVTFSITNTGSGLAWTARQSHSSNNDCTLYAWSAVATAGSSGTVTATHTNTSQMAIGVYQFRAPTGFTIAVGASSLGTSLSGNLHVALAMSSADSAVVWSAGDWSAAAAETPSPAATSHTATTPGPSASPVAVPDGTHYTFYFDELDDETATGSQNFGYNGSSAGPFTVAAVEVKLTSTGGTVLPVRSLVVGQAVNRAGAF